MENGASTTPPCATIDQDVYAEPAQSNWVRYGIYALIGVVAVSFTLLFVGGFIKW